MKKAKKDNTIIFSRDNAETINNIVKSNRNIVVCGIQGVGKITNAINGVRDIDNVYLVENTFDYDGKLKERGYIKYINYLLSLKKDLTILQGLVDEKSADCLSASKRKVIIIDGIYGRTDQENEVINRLLDDDYSTVILIVRCIKYLGRMIKKFDIIVELTQDGALLLSADTADMICKVLKDSDLTD